MNEIVNKIKELNIIEVITRVCGVSLGYNDMMACPFHDEDTPSLKVYPKTGTFKCFGCQKQGDAIEFVQNYHSLTFVGAVKLIAEAYGFDMPVYAGKKRDYSFVEGYNRVADFGHIALVNTSNDKSVKVLNYLYSRGLSDQVIQKFNIGYWNESGFAPGKTLQDLFIDQGVSSSNFRSLERHRDRLLIPLYNGNGSQVLGFASRALSKESMIKSGKYTNDMNSEHKFGYNKSAYLFGYHLLEPKTFVYVVEGYLDAVFMHELNLNAVGIGGTSITDTHASILMKKFKKIIMSFDNDKAGVYKTFENLRRFDGHDIEFTLWPIDTKDAGDFVLKHRDDELLSGNVIQYISHLWNNNFCNIHKDVDARLAFCDLIVDNTRHFVPIMKAEIETIIVKLIKEFTVY